MPRIPIFGAGLNAKSGFVTAKRMQNFYAEVRPMGEKSALVGYQTPGLSSFVDFGDTPPRGGIEFEPSSVDYIVHRGVLWEVNNAGLKTNRGTLSTSSGRVSMAHNGLQVMIVDGTYGYIYSTVAAVGTAQTINTITRSGTVGTLTTLAPHGLVTGNLVTLAGQTPTAYAGSYTITVTGATTFTFNMTADPGGSASPVGTYTNPPFVQIAQAGFPANPTTVTFLTGRFIVSINASSRFYVSGSGSIVYDGLYWDALYFASAETNPDPLIAVWASNGQLLLLGSLTMEFWGNSGTLDFPFVALQGTATEWGLAARWSVAKYDNSIACLIKNRMGQVMVAQLQGYLPKKISTPDIDSIINGYSSTADASVYSYMLGGHPMIVISFPSAGYTWLFDGSTGFWSPLKSYGLTRHRAEFSVNLVNSTLVADYASGKLYKLLPTALTDNGDSIEREIVSENIAQPDLEYLSVDCVRLDMEVGDGVAGYGAPFNAINYMSVTGASGVYASTPNSSALNIPIDLQIVTLDALDDWTPAAAQTLVSKYNPAGNQQSFILIVNPGGTITLGWSANGATVLTATSTAALPAVDGSPLWIKATLDVVNVFLFHTVTFYTSADSITTDPAAVTWTQLEAAVSVAGATSVFNSTAALNISGYANGTTTPMAGKVYRTQIYSGIGGTLVADFNANDGGVGSTSFASTTTGETYTLNGAAAINFQATAQGTNTYIIPATQGADPQISLSISRDNGKTYGPEIWKSAGKVGDYRRRVEWRRCGTARAFNFKFRMTDPVPLTVVSACINPEN